MRRTVDLDDDLAAAVRRLRENEGLSLSAAVNKLARAGLGTRSDHEPFRQGTVDIGVTIEHGLAICSADTDVARFSEVRWHNPLAA